MARNVLTCPNSPTLIPLFQAHATECRFAPDNLYSSNSQKLFTQLLLMCITHIHDISPVDNRLHFPLNSAAIFRFFQLTSSAQKSTHFTHILQHLVLTISISLYRLWVIGFIQLFLPVLFSCFFLNVSSFCMACEFLIQRPHFLFKKS